MACISGLYYNPLKNTAARANGDHKNEKNFPTQQPEKAQQARVPRPHGHSWGPPCAQQPPQARP
jgi:hypothetical protein